MPRFSDCVVCFTQVYDQCLPTRRIRDYDNLEEKQLLDVLSTFVMADDTGLLCDATTPLRWAKRTVPESVSWKKAVSRLAC